LILLVKDVVIPVNLGKTAYKYSASSHPLLVYIVLLGFGFETDFSVMVGPLVNTFQNYSEITFDDLLMEAAIINENKVLSF